jgi:hypothetical protein
MTYPADYNQQIYAYLQAWRQFLEPLTAMAAMAAGMAYPAAPWAGPGMYPTPTAPSLPPYPPPYPAPAAAPTAPVAPAQLPADYAQQLFGYLQGWRQQLEQLTGTGPAYPPAGSDTAPPGRRPLPPDPPDAGKSSIPADGTGSLYPRPNATPSVDPHKLAAVAPVIGSGSQMPGVVAVDGPQLRRDSINQAAVVARGPQIATAPMAEPGQMRQRGFASPRATDTPVARAVTANAPVQAVPRSNFAGLANRALRKAERG